MFADKISKCAFIQIVCTLLHINLIKIRYFKLLSFDTACCVHIKRPESDRSHVNFKIALNIICTTDV